MNLPEYYAHRLQIRHTLARRMSCLRFQQPSLFEHEGGADEDARADGKDDANRPVLGWL